MTSNGCEGKIPMNPDMSDHALTTRLKRVEQLRRLCLTLGRAEPVHQVVCESFPPAAIKTAPTVAQTQSPTGQTLQCKTQ